MPGPSSYSVPTMPKKPSPSNLVVTMLAFLVMALLGAGMISLQARSLIEAPVYPYTPDEYLAYVRVLDQISFIGAVLLDVGVGMLLLTSIVVAVKRDDVAEMVRRGLLILATVVTALWLFAAFFSTSLGIP